MLQKAKAALLVTIIAVSLVALPAAALPGAEDRQTERSWAPIALGLDLFGDIADLLVRWVEKAGSVMIADGAPVSGAGTSTNNAPAPGPSAGN